MFPQTIEEAEKEGYVYFRNGVVGDEYRKDGMVALYSRETRKFIHAIGF